MSSVPTLHFQDAAAFIMPVNTIYRPDLIAPAMRLLAAAGKGQALSEDEAQIALTGLVSRARHIINVPAEALSKTSLQGECGWTQSALMYWLEDAGLQGKPAAFQSIFWREDYYCHVWTSVELPVHSGRQWFLLDPSYQQFCVETKHGKCAARDFAYAQTLADHGFLKLTPDVAMAYFTALNLGKPLFEDAQEAMHFMKHPPVHAHNVYFARGLIANALRNAPQI